MADAGALEVLGSEEAGEPDHSVSRLQKEQENLQGKKIAGGLERSDKIKEM